MKILIQKDFENILKPFTSEIDDFVVNIEGEDSGEVAIGDRHFLASIKNKDSFKYRILISDSQQLQLNQLKNIHPFNISKSSDTENIKLQLQILREKLEKNLKASLVAKEIQKKRKELELLNTELLSESEVQFSSLEESNTEEMQKNLNEKSLLYFLDFISSESLNDDFVSQILKLLWKELKKMGYAYQIGFCFENLNTTVSLISYNGIVEKNETLRLDLEQDFSSNLLTSALGRPVGKIYSWRLTEFSRKGFFFVESIDQQFLNHQLQAYFKERLFTLSLYFDRWLIEKEYHLLIERWDQTFQSFSGYTHVIDENYKVHKANYLKKEDKDKFCYQVLAGRPSPCEECPIKAKSTVEFYLTPQKRVRASHSEFIHSGNKYYFLLYEDLTNLDFLKSKMIQTEKMATVGRLGNHLSHELNNPLTGLKMYTQLLLGSEKEDYLTASLKSDFQEILKASDRCEKIIKNLLQFSQQTEIQLQALSFSDVLEGTLTLLKTALRPHRLFVDLKKTLISADFTALQQVLFNLLKNACQAMETAGSIKIFEVETATEVIFCIQDSGAGLRDDIRKNLFTPFVTTKKVGEGTGLGLYLSKKLMLRMNADIVVNKNYKSGLQIDLVFKKL